MIYLRYVIATLLCFSVTLISLEKTIQVCPVDLSSLQLRPAIPLHLEHAITQDETVWGLMNRESLPKDSGMLFYYATPHRLTIWSLNCLMNLSVAFLDDKGVIREFRDLYAHPEKMCKLPPLECAKDVLSLSSCDPVVRFFMSRSICSTYPAKYAFETNFKWFQEVGAKIGDVIKWNGQGGNGWLAFTMDITCLKPSTNQPILLRPKSATVMALWSVGDNQARDIAFLDGEGRILSAMTLPGGASFSPQFRPVAFSNGPVKAAIVAAPGWLISNDLYPGIELSWD